MNEFIPENMVKMAMGVEEQYGLQGIFFNKLFQVLPFFRKITARVDNATLFFFVIQDIGILFNRIKTKRPDG
jgi:hypothetical protein